MLRVIRWFEWHGSEHDALRRGLLYHGAMVIAGVEVQA